MIITHLKEFILSAAYLALLFINFFFIHFHYSDIFTYHFFNGLLAFTNLYAIQVYETIMTELYLATLLTVFSVLPIIWLHIICYLVPGLYMHELDIFYRRYAKLLTIFLFESFIFLLIFLPHALGRGFIINNREVPPELTIPNELNGYESRVVKLPGNVADETWRIDTESSGITQIYSYSNVVNLTAKLIIIWGVLTIVLRTTTWQRKYLPLIILLMSVWVTPPDIKIQVMLTFTLFLYLEGHVWIKFWKTRREKYSCSSLRSPREGFLD